MFLFPRGDTDFNSSRVTRPPEIRSKITRHRVLRVPGNERRMGARRLLSRSFRARSRRIMVLVKIMVAPCAHDPVTSWASSRRHVHFSFFPSSFFPYFFLLPLSFFQTQLSLTAPNTPNLLVHSLGWENAWVSLLLSLWPKRIAVGKKHEKMWAFVAGKNSQSRWYTQSRPEWLCVATSCTFLFVSVI